MEFSQLFKSVTLNGHAVFGAHPHFHKMSRTMQAEETTQHQPEETSRPMTDEEWEEFQKWKTEELDNRPPTENASRHLLLPPPMSSPPPNVLKATLTNVTGGMHFLVTNLEMPLHKKDHLWAELQDVFAMFNAEIAKKFDQQ